MASKTDQKLFSLIAKEEKRQQDSLEMIPSENYVSPAVLKASGSVLTNKYSEGYPGKRYYAGNDIVDEIEEVSERIPEVTFEFVDSVFNFPLKHAIDICKEIIRRDLKLKFRTMGINIRLSAA